MSSDIRIGQKLKILRELNNYNQTYLGQILGISQNAYSKIELNQTKLSIEQAQILAKLYKIDIADLLSQENPIISFVNNDSATYGKSYVNNNYETPKDANDPLIQAKDQQISSLEKQIENQQNQIENYQKQIESLMELLKKK